MIADETTLHHRLHGIKGYQHQVTVRFNNQQNMDDTAQQLSYNITGHDKRDSCYNTETKPLICHST